MSQVGRVIDTNTVFTSATQYSDQRKMRKKKNARLRFLTFVLFFSIPATIFSGLILRPQQKKAGFEARLERHKATQFVEMFLRNPIRE